MSRERQCSGSKADGSPCGAVPQLVNADGLCPAHRPGGRREMSERGRKGGRANKRAAGLDPSELPPLTSHADAQSWLETIGREVASGRLPERQAQAAIRAVAEWVRAEGERAAVEVLDELRAEIDELKSSLASGSIRAI